MTFKRTILEELLVWVGLVLGFLPIILFHDNRLGALGFFVLIVPGFHRSVETIGKVIRSLKRR